MRVVKREPDILNPKNIYKKKGKYIMADEKVTAGQAAVNAAAPVMRSIAGPAFSAALETVMQTKAEKRAQKYYKENQPS